MSRLLTLTMVSLFLIALAASASAEPSFFNSRCASCHSDDSPTCDGCHNHRGNRTASAPGSPFAPGDPLTVNFNGGDEHGWIRAILYDDANVVQALLSGPTGTGDDGGTDDVVFPVQLQATAPLSAGTYVWQAAWFGGATNGGGAHLEVRTNVSFEVDDTNTGIPDDLDGNATWSEIKALY